MRFETGPASSLPPAEVPELKEPIEITTARPEDAKDIETILRECWLTTYPSEEIGITADDINKLDFGSPERISRRQQAIEGNPEQRTWVAKEAEKIIGFCAAEKKEDFGYISSIYILQEYQSRKIGKKLLQEAFDWLGPNQEIDLDVAQYNERAIAAYKKLGFVETGKEGEHGLKPGGKALKLIRMKRPPEYIQ